MNDLVGAHNDLHSELGARKGEHPGRSRNPVIKVRDIAWLEFEKPDLVRAEAFAHAFGFGTVLRTDGDLLLRGTDANAPCVIVRRGSGTRFLGAAYQAQDERDVLRLAEANDVAVRPLPEEIGGLAADLVDPSGVPVHVVAGMHPLESLPAQTAHTFNVGHELRRVNAMQRPPREPTKVQRLGHLVVQTTKYLETLNWYLDNLGMIVSDFLYFPGQRDRGPTMSFVRCDRGPTPADQVCDLDALAAGGEYLRERGYFRSWGIGRHIQGSQLFDYWRDPDGFMVEHFADGDVFDSTLEPGWAPFTSSGLSQWGPPITKDFLGTNPKSLPHEARSLISALRDDNEFDINRLIGLLKAASS
jgi:hypothetical protein